MRTIHRGSLLATALATLLLGACASSDVGDIFPGNGGAVSEVKGIVRSVDTRNDCVIELDNASTTNYRLNNGYGTPSGGRSTVFCDNNTRVVFQGKTFRPQDLERGDEIIADVADVGGRLVADRIDVTYDASSNDRYGSSGTYGNDRYGRNGSNGGYNGGYGNDGSYNGGANGGYGSGTQGNDRYGATDPYGGNHDLRGTVRAVDARSRTMTLERVDYFNRNFDRGQGGDLLTLYYDPQTRVAFNGQTYSPENLEVGDVIAVNVEDVRGTLVADQIDVVSDVRGNAAQYPR